MEENRSKRVPVELYNTKNVIDVSSDGSHNNLSSIQTKYPSLKQPSPKELGNNRGSVPDVLLKT
jgi:hypothetical protein